MADPLENRVHRLREQCEGREAIYVEKGGLRVRVTNIRAEGGHVVANVEEIPSRGLPIPFVPRTPIGECLPRRWQISSDFYLGSFSELTWRAAPYVGWTLYFEPGIIKAVLNLAAGWPDDLPVRAQFREFGRLMADYASGRRPRI